jgi:hypothetical protein
MSRCFACGREMTEEEVVAGFKKHDSLPREDGWKVADNEEFSIISLLSGPTI